MAKTKASRKRKHPIGRPPMGPPEPIPDTEANIIKTVLKDRSTEELKGLGPPRRRKADPDSSSAS